MEYQILGFFSRFLSYLKISRIAVIATVCYFLNLKALLVFELQVEFISITFDITFKIIEEVETYITYCFYHTFLVLVIEKTCFFFMEHFYIIFYKKYIILKGIR